VKIIQVDNFDRETIGVSDDRLVAENIEHESLAKVMCEALNKKYSAEFSSVFFRVVNDDYELRIFEP